MASAIMEPRPDRTSAEEPESTPAPLTSTALFYACADIMAETAQVLGKYRDAERYARLAAAIQSAFNAEFFDETTGHYGPGTQTALAVPLWLGIVPEQQRHHIGAQLIEVIRAASGHVTTGIIGTAALEHALPEIDAAETMYEIATQTTYPSWGYQIGQGSTTIWETWGDLPPKFSVNMKMFASTERFFYRDVAGISPAAPGWKKILVRPSVVRKLTSAKARVHTVRGDAAIDWRVEDGQLLLDLEVPATSRADVWLPTGVVGTSVLVTEGDSVVWRDRAPCTLLEGIVAARRTADHVRLEVGGGGYSFRIVPQDKG
jgi:alpha-L-rhamnosidase